MKDRRHTVRGSGSPVLARARGNVLQRKCSCGGALGPTGDCAECHRKRFAEKKGPAIQAKLFLNRPGDRYEQEADQTADAVVQATRGRPQDSLPNARPVPLKTLVHSKATDSLLRPLGNGEPLPTSTRRLFEPEFGWDFRKVRIHRGPQAADQARALGAKAFAYGRHLVFNRDSFAPHTGAGQRILAHELTHVVQQAEATPTSASNPRQGEPVIRETNLSPQIARQLDPSMCSSDCAKEDATGAATKKFTLTIYADKEGSFLLLPGTHKVGHSWLRLEDDKGMYWTYGFWPQTGYNSNVRADVEGCVHHPDTEHTPTASQKFELTASQFADAFNLAVKICNEKPKYNLFGLQCTEFVNRIIAAAGKGSFGGFGLIWESPNALDSWIRTNSLVLGASTTAATSATQGSGTGAVGLDLTYRHQFYSLLGEKLRFYGLGRAEISSPVKSLTAGAGLELNPQKIWLPAPFIEGGASLGDISAEPGGSRFGAGPNFGAGLRYNIDELGFVGVEYNFVKDVVNREPALHRLMITAGIRLF